MMMQNKTKFFFSQPFSFAFLLAVTFLTACSTNPATGDRQFTALMSPEQEIQIGAGEHKKVMQMFGDKNIDPALQTYVGKIGARVSKKTERPDVQYKFTVIDTPMVNAFAIPGGYIYASRGLMTLANSEGELASVLAHETGHITARHSAERYSRGVLASLGATALSIAIGSDTATQMLGLSSELYVKSYSRAQEHQADELGVRYLYRGGYDPFSMARFLTNLDNNTKLDLALAGKGEASPYNYFSTHPQTGERIARASNIAAKYPKDSEEVSREKYLRAIDGMIYGDSPQQGYVRGRHFYHVPMDFTFSVPEGFTLNNQPTQVVATAENGTVILFDAVGNRDHIDALGYITRVWMTDKALPDAERITINGNPAATASFGGAINGAPVTIRLVAVEWAPDKIFRFQMAIPQGASKGLIEELRRATYSLRSLTADEKRTIKPYRVRIVTAKAGDSVASLARHMPFATMQEERFRVLNGMRKGEQLAAGRLYKTITAR